MNAQWWLTQILYRFVEVLPWLVGGGAVFAIVSWSPLGRALLQHLRERRRDAAASEELLAELAAVRQVLGEVTERLDGTEQQLARRTHQQDRMPTPV